MATNTQEDGVASGFMVHKWPVKRMVHAQRGEAEQAAGALVRLHPDDTFVISDVVAAVTAHGAGKGVQA